MFISNNKQAKTTEQKQNIKRKEKETPKKIFVKFLSYLHKMLLFFKQTSDIRLSKRLANSELAKIEFTSTQWKVICSHS